MSSKVRSSTASAYTMKLLCCTALVGSAALLVSTAVQAQNEVVTVTGTSIRGTAPVGSNVISVDRAAIEESGATTISELMANIPQVSGAGSANGFGSSGQRQETGGGNVVSPGIHSLGTQASIATLILIDGHVFAPVGQTTMIVDPSVIPAAGLQRVEVMPDGASSIYGANAVAGVINYITRKDYNGWETRVQAGMADHYNTFSVSQVFGHTWETGSVMAVYGYSSRSNLYNGHRAFQTPRQDIRLGAMTAAQSALFASGSSGLPTVAPAGIPVTLPSGPGVAGSDAYRGATIPWPSVGSNFQNFNCPVAAISTASNANAFLYPYTSGAGSINNVVVTNGSGGTKTQDGFSRSVTGGGTVGVCDTSNLGTDLFSSTQNNFMVSIRQSLTDRISVNVDLVRGSNFTTARNARGSVSATVFSPLVGTGGPAFGSNQTNPFYVTVPGATGSTRNSEFVSFNFAQLLPGDSFDKGDTIQQFATLGVDVDLGSNWALSVGSTLGASAVGTTRAGEINSAEAILALNGTTNSNGTGVTGTTSSVLADPYGLGTVTNVTRALTTANALDVWNPAATNRTSQAVLRSLTDNNTRIVGYNNIQDVVVKLDGPLGDPWGAGPVKAAFGANFDHLTQPQTWSEPGISGPSSTSSRGRQFNYNRTSYAVFVEFLVPLINEDMGIPLVNKLVADISGRYDHFSDFGVTKNPKVSLQWDIFSGLTGRGTYSTSFVAPNVHDVGGPTGVNSQSQVSSGQLTNARIFPFLSVSPQPYSQDPFSARGVGTAGTIVETPATCLALNSIAGSNAPTSATARLVDSTGALLASQVASAPTGTGAGQAYGCQLTTTSNPNFSGLRVVGARGFSLKPETGLTFSAGLDLDAGKFWDLLEGFTASVTYYNTKFMNVITSAQVEQNIPEATSFGPAVNPNDGLPGWSSSDPNIQAIISQRALTTTLPARIYTIVDTGIQNPFTIWQAGFDFTVGYRLETDSLGTFNWSVSANQIARFSQKANSATATVLDVGDCKNGARYCTSELQGSMHLGWRLGDISTSLTFNYVHPYNAPNSNFPWSLVGPTVNGQVTRQAGFEHVGSLQTFDLNVAYALPSDLLEGTSVSVNVQNLFDRPPPFFDSATGFTNGSEIGRIVSMSLTKKW